MIVAIDGTTGSGKSTISKKLALKTGFTYVRTGSFYRAIAYKLMQNGIDKDDEKAIKEILKTTKISSKLVDGSLQVVLDGKLVSLQINSPEVSNFVSKISPLEYVREYVRVLQKDSAKASHNIIMEGRDIGSVVFPNADIKVYVDCNIDERAKRRVEQYKKSGKIISKQQAKHDILERDKDDMLRHNSPLVKLPDAFLLDTTHLTIDECIVTLENLINSKREK